MKLITHSFSAEKNTDIKNKIIPCAIVEKIPVTKLTAKPHKFVAYDVPVEIICEILSCKFVCNVLKNA